ncbi:DUF5696 domain-containing protein [Fundicoccus sp. Sow4_H7]|uniref:DUF5696 domain-containing protein n=1 Tax=Fundicoccus sp. Sow4_H7 TaxID=3438784 RepID=UPI003F8F7169
MKIKEKVCILLFILCGLVFAELNAIPFALAQEEDVVTELEEQGKTIVVENDTLILAIDERNYSVTIANKDNGIIWLSNPVDPNTDAIATGVSKDKLSSQLSISYINLAGQVSTMNSYTDSVEYDQVVMEVMNDGVKVTYTLGEEISGFLIPDIISSERFQMFLDQMTDEERRAVEDIYRADEENGIFVLRTGTAVFIQEEAQEYFANAGYTVEDYHADNEEHAIEGSEGAIFEIPVLYELDGEDFIASILSDDIVNSDSFNLTNISFLEYFGTASVEDEGYIFVPDGSGALIYLNNGKTNAARHVADVYGSDESLTYMQTTSRDKEMSNRLPVFGMKKNDQAFLAIIEDGDAYGRIIGDISGRADSFNKAFSEFRYLPNGRASLDEMTGSGILQLYQQEPYSGNFQVRYRFLYEDDANYSGMVNSYREYLQSKNEFPDVKERESLPFYLGLTGAITTDKSFLGIPYQGTEVLTSYEQAQLIMNQLLSDSITNIRVKYAGWFNGGLNHSYPSSINPIRQLNTDVSLDEFLAFTQSVEIPVYFDVDFSYVYQDSLWDGFSIEQQANRYLDNSLVTILDDSLVSGNVGRETSTNLPKYLLNPSQYESVIEDFMNDIPSVAMDSLSLRTLTSTLVSDFSRNNFVDRQSSLDFIKNSMTNLKERTSRLMASNANVYALNYVDDIIRVPMTSNKYAITDESIPFYQMLLSGYIDFSGQPLNLTGDYQEELLKSIETNAGIFVEWIAEPNYILKETQHQDLYSVYYGNWYDQIKDLYHTINTELEAVQGQSIILHQKIENDVYEVTYANGVKVIINYSNQPFQYEGKAVEAKDFLVIEEV